MVVVGWHGGGLLATIVSVAMGNIPLVGVCGMLVLGHGGIHGIWC